MRVEFVIIELYMTFSFYFSVLFISILAFCAAGSLILSDNRRQLLNSVQLYQPSFLYAYLAIFIQGGVIQVTFTIHSECPKASLKLNTETIIRTISK